MFRSIGEITFDLIKKELHNLLKKVIKLHLGGEKNACNDSCLLLVSTSCLRFI